AERVRGAGADFRPADDFLEGLLGRLEAARPASSGPTGSVASHAGAIETPKPSVETERPAPHTVVRTGPIAAGDEIAATMFDPLAALKVAEAEAESRRDQTVTQPSAEPSQRQE